ncbi:hypothetical protein [Paenibacillus brevis]|uniref:hypothetical protein n=1 Tax=Paenibacillus brevis TaxID=2841508 RepID=UPI001C118428|nr:hypothetical protein [Paenibacillus brevis]
MIKEKVILSRVALKFAVADDTLNRITSNGKAHCAMQQIDPDSVWHLEEKSCILGEQDAG